MPVNNTNSGKKDIVETFNVENTYSSRNPNLSNMSFEAGIEGKIYDLIKDKKNLKLSDILDKYGDQPVTHNQIKKLLLENKLIMYELNPTTDNDSDYHKQEIKFADHTLSQWVNLSSQPCIMCEHFVECEIGNPISPTSCSELNQWIDDEIEFDSN
ncbi:MAG: hypothetical protein OEZ01_00685 [Candidatus Heimdallarchaeota archaeon]|nr:hypothetical protein [Candidatus Heimdallarchaeota archaeon]MDH5644488.1 hypothetical protein [Candidatus Heimdallarchaeota archaeon]